MKSIRIKTTPFLVLQRILVADVVGAFIIIGISFLIDYAEVYNIFPFAEGLSVEIASALIVILFHMILLTLSFISWNNEYYLIENGKITRRYPGLMLKKEIVPIGNIASITYKQTFIGRALDYGSLELLDSKTSKKHFLSDIPSPARYLKQIERLVRTSQKVIEEQAKSVKELINSGENKNVEYKASFRWDYNKSQPNKELEKVVIKSLVGFLNSDGGTLIIGVNDDRELIGLENDLKTLRKRNPDGYENALTTTFNSMVGVELRQNLDVTFHTIKDQQICAITIKPSHKPVYLKHNSTEEFYIRAGNSTQPLTMSEATEYIQNHFKPQKQ